jgi:hypothetical protein
VEAQLRALNSPARASQSLQNSVVHESACSVGTDPVQESGLFLDLWVSAVPFKLNQDRHHHVPRQ